MKLITSIREGQVILDCDCGRREFHQAAEKYVCSGCGKAYVVQGETGRAKPAERMTYQKRRSRV